MNEPDEDIRNRITPFGVVANVLMNRGMGHEEAHITAGVVMDWFARLDMEVIDWKKPLT